MCHPVSWPAGQLNRRKSFISQNLTRNETRCVIRAKMFMHRLARPAECVCRSIRSLCDKRRPTLGIEQVSLLVIPSWNFARRGHSNWRRNNVRYNVRAPGGLYLSEMCSRGWRQTFYRASFCDDETTAPGSASCGCITVVSRQQNGKLDTIDHTRRRPKLRPRTYACKRASQSYCHWKRNSGFTLFANCDGFHVSGD